MATCRVLLTVVRTETLTLTSNQNTDFMLQIGDPRMKMESPYGGGDDEDEDGAGVYAVLCYEVMCLW